MCEQLHQVEFFFLSIIAIHLSESFYAVAAIPVAARPRTYRQTALKHIIAGVFILKMVCMATGPKLEKGKKKKKDFCNFNGSPVAVT